MVLDVGFSDPLDWPPDMIAAAEIDLPGFPAVVVPLLPIEQHLAEKVHAYSRGYGPNNPASTRPKDLIDIVLLADIATGSVILASRLREALERTFAFRATHPLPSQLHRPPERWVTAYRALAREVGVAPELSEAHAAAATLLDPILGDQADGTATWDWTQHRWSTNSQTDGPRLIGAG